MKRDTALSVRNQAVHHVLTVSVVVLVVLVSRKDKKPEKKANTALVIIMSS